MFAYKNETTMILLSALLSEELSDAAEQAHKLGLVSGGWGTWKDASGKTVAKTIQGQLVKLDDVAELDDEDVVNDFAQHVRDKYKLKAFELNINSNTGDLRLDSIRVAKDQMGAGSGTKAMDDLVSWADAHNKRITLTPAEKSSEWGTTSKARLQKFYKRFDFVPNKGRHKDFRISDTMIRNPKSKIK